MSTLVKFAASLVAFTTSVRGAHASEHEKIVFRSFEEAIGKFEFDWEVHQVTTADGYILNMFRLLGP